MSETTEHTTSEKPPKVCVQCSKEYTNYSQQKSKFCSSVCRAKYSKENKITEINLPPANEPAFPTIQTPSLPMGKIDAKEGVPYFLYELQKSNADKFERKCEQLDRDNRDKDKRIAELEKELEVGKVKHELEKPATLGGMPTDVLMTLIANPDSIRAVFDGLGNVLGKKQLGAGNDIAAAVAEVFSKQSPEMQQKLATMLQYFVTNPQQLDAFIASLTGAQH